jgi:hypothetical protein
VAKYRTIFILSDIHYAGAAEQSRGATELAAIANPALRLCVRGYRRFIWKRDPFAHNYLLDRFLESAGDADYVVGNGDYSCDTAFIGVSDDACLQSARECVTKLRRQFGPRLWLTLGDHELGKMSLFGGRGGPRIASCERAQRELGLAPFWEVRVGKNVLMGTTSSLVAFPVFEPEALAAECGQWHELRRKHLKLIRESFLALQPDERVMLFCHDPTALPFLWREPVIQSRLPQISTTIIGHLHSQLFVLSSRLLSGMPVLTGLGNSIRRMSSALHEARVWKYFRVKLCPALAGIELLKDGGYLRMELDPQGARPPVFHRHFFFRADSRRR